MLKPEQIPHEAMRAFYEQMAVTINPREAIAAALSAWPGVVERTSGVNGEIKSRRLILPLTTQENGDE